MSLKIKYQLLLFFAISMVLLSCGKESSCFKGTGKIVEEQRTISSGVTTIIAEDNIDIILTQSNEASLTIEGGENLLPYINTDISGNELTISSDNKCSMLRDYSIPITAYLSIPDLTKISCNGQGNISSTNTLNFPDFQFETSKGTGSINLELNSKNVSVIQHSGPADITLRGSTDFLYVYTLGNGWFYLNKLVSKSVHVSHSGSGDINVNANDELRIELRSVGNVVYYGDPVLNVTLHTGDGKIIKK